MLCLQHDSNSLGFELRAEALRDLDSQSLLQLQVASKELDDASEFRQAELTVRLRYRM